MYTMTDPDTVYDAKVMPEDSSEPVYASRLGETPQAAKDAVLDASERKVPPATHHNLEWDDDNVQMDGWIFHLKEREVNTED
jgi:hypothetical protein